MNGIKPRKLKEFIDTLPLSPGLSSSVQDIAVTLSKQINHECFTKKYAPVKETLMIIGTGAFIAASFAVPSLPMALKPFLDNSKKKESWKQLNIPYLKRTIKQLEKERYVEVKEVDGSKQVSITERGQRRILRYALDEIDIKKPSQWDERWRLVSYDVPLSHKREREILRGYLQGWKFYPLHESVFLHAYPCEKEVTFLREYLGISQFVRFFWVSHIEHDSTFREYFDI